MTNGLRYSDLREWLEIVEQTGELRHVKGADPIWRSGSERVECKEKIPFRLFSSMKSRAINRVPSLNRIAFDSFEGLC